MLPLLCYTVQDIHGHTALLVACQNGHYKVYTQWHQEFIMYSGWHTCTCTWHCTSLLQSPVMCLYYLELLAQEIIFFALIAICCNSLIHEHTYKYNWTRKGVKINIFSDVMIIMTIIYTLSVCTCMPPRMYLSYLYCMWLCVCVFLVVCGPAARVQG